WGQIAAANSISDVFAMGGSPLVALNVVAFPLSCLPLDMLKKLMEGGASKVSESGAFLMGGHSVEDKEPKYGLCVFGEVERNAMWRTTGARPGDALVLTKPLGTGIAATGIKAEMAEPELAQAAEKWMTKLNDLPRSMSAPLRTAVHAATDVTGFGFAGHALDMLSSHTVDLTLETSALPTLPGADDLSSMGLLPAGAYRNEHLYAPQMDGLEKIAQETRDFLFDPQTSGGLLLAAPPDAAGEIATLARKRGFDQARVIGHFTDGTGRIVCR
ncbi:MAG: selenide, water dikinase SelD, partial [Pyramidobacter sp.]|nr:selenide, water dikinase SelD [Pyramidobacter sp.]